MKIRWCGHATFLLEGNGTRIVTDPYTPEVAGYDPIDRTGGYCDYEFSDRPVSQLCGYGGG